MCQKKNSQCLVGTVLRYSASFLVFARLFFLVCLLMLAAQSLVALNDLSATTVRLWSGYESVRLQRLELTQRLLDLSSESPEWRTLESGK